jgi:hypothetical protein
MEKYGADKLAVVKETEKRPHVLDKYRKAKQANPPRPLTHAEIADVEGTPTPDFKQILDAIKALPVGKEHATKYEDLIERLLSSLFYPSLSKTRFTKVESELILRTRM